MGLTVSPFSGPAGTVLAINATELGPNEAVEIMLDEGPPRAATADANGVLNLSLATPRGWAPHLHYVYIRRPEGTELAEHPFRVISGEGRVRVEKSGPFIDRLVRELDGQELERAEFTHTASTRPSDEVAVELRYEKAGRTRLEGSLSLNRTTGQLSVRIFNAHDSLLVIIEGELNEPLGTDPLSRMRASVTIADAVRVIKLEPGLDLPEHARKRSSLVGELQFLAQRMRDSDLFVDVAELDALTNDADLATPASVLLATYFTFALMPHGGPLPTDLVPGLLIRLLCDELTTLATYHRFRDVVRFADDEDPDFDYLVMPEGVEDFDDWAKAEAERIRAADDELANADPACTFVGYSVERSVVFQVTKRVPQTGWIYTGQNGGTSLTLGNSISYFNRSVTVTEAEFIRIEIEFRYTCGHWFGSLGGLDDESRTRVYKKPANGATRTYADKDYKQGANYKNGIGGKFVIVAAHYPDPRLTGSFAVVQEGLAVVANAEAVLAKAVAVFDPTTPPDGNVIAAYTGLQRAIETTLVDARRERLRADEIMFHENRAALIEIETSLHRKLETVALDLQRLTGFVYHPARLDLEGHGLQRAGSLTFPRRFQLVDDVINIEAPPSSVEPPTPS